MTMAAIEESVAIIMVNIYSDGYQKVAIEEVAMAANDLSLVKKATTRNDNLWLLALLHSHHWKGQQWEVSEI